MKCDYCHQDPGAKPNGVWKGFLDKDTNQHVCWGCQPRHYHEKFKTPGQRTYSEFPVMTYTPQLSLNFNAK
jgi:hypothetical protein